MSIFSHLTLQEHYPDNTELTTNVFRCVCYFDVTCFVCVSVCVSLLTHILTPFHSNYQTLFTVDDRNRDMMSIHSAMVTPFDLL